MSFLSKLFKSNVSTEENQQPVSYLNPYSTLGELDFHLINEGRHEKLWEALGAHVMRDKDGALLGTAFSVWAQMHKPSA